MSYGGRSRLGGLVGWILVLVLINVLSYIFGWSFWIF